MADGYLELSVSDLQSPSGVAQLNQMLQSIYNNMSSDTVNTKVFYGYGSPEAAVTANVGSIYMRQDGGANTSVYRKESGGGNTGWVASTNVTLPLSVANGGSGQDASSVAQGSIFYFSATGVITALGPGTSGQFLQTLGSSANPQWATVNAAYTAGDYSLTEDNSFYQESSATPTKHSEFYLNRSGTLRIKFYLGNGAGTANGRIYRNGSAVGTARSGTGLYSEDVSGWSAGDLCQLYLNDSNGGNNTYGGAFQLFEGTPANTEINRVTYPVQRIYSSPVDPVTATLTGLGRIGDYVSNTSGGASTTLYVKTAATTWTAK